MDKELFWKLLEPVHPKAEAFCRKLAGNRDDGDDLYQEALLTAMRKFESLKELSAFRPWLFRIMVNSYKNLNRESWWRRRVMLGRGGAEMDLSNDPTTEYQTRRWLNMALSALSSEDRAIVVLYEIEGWSVADLTDMLGKPEGTIKARLFRARRKMRKSLERCLPELNTKISVSEGKYALQRSDTADK